MINQDNIKAIASVLHVDAEQLQTALTSQDEVTLEIPELVSMPKPDFDTRIQNEKSTGYNEGKKAGIEMEVKQAREKLGLQFEGKSIDGLLNAFEQSVVAKHKIEPNKAIEEKEAIITQLRANIGKLEEEKTKIAETFAKKERQSKIEQTILTAIPDAAVSNTLGRNDIAVLFKSSYEVDFDNEKPVVKKDGQVVANSNTLEPLSLSQIMTTFVTEKGLLKNEGGRGDGSQTGQQHKAGTLDAFSKEMKDKGIEYNSPEYYKEMTQRIKDGTLKV